MKKKLAKSLALILVLALVCSLAPSAFAAEPVYATEISPSSQSVSVFAGKTADLKVTVTPSDYSQGVVWTSGDETVVSLKGTAVSGAGGVSTQTITGVKAGTAAVTAKVFKNASEFYTATFTVTVKDDYVSGVAVTTTEGDAKTAITSANLYPNAVLQLYALTSYASGDTKTGNVSWTTSAPSVANPDSNGKITAISAGTATITAASKSDSTKSASVTVNVTATPTMTIKADKSTIKVKDTLTLTAESTTTGYTLSANNIAWTSSDTSVVTLKPATGSSTVATAVKDGRVTISAVYTYTDPSDSKVKTTSSTYALTVSGGSVTAVSLDKNTYMGLNTSGSITAVTTPTNGTYKSAAWTSSNPYVVSVSGSGLTAGLYGRSEGTSAVTLTITKDDGGLITATSQVTVTDLSNSSAADQAVIGTDLSLSNISDMLTAKFAYAYGVTPSASSTITFSSLGSSTYGTLYEKSSSMNIFGTVDAGTAYKFSALAPMVFKPASAGAYTMPYTISDTTNGRTMTGTITINVSTNSLIVTVSLSGSTPYSFASAVNSDGVSAANQISASVYAKFGKTCDHIVFSNSVSSGSNVGTLYADSSKTGISYSNRTFYYSGSTKPVTGLYFVPAAAGTYVRTFSAYDTTGSNLGECELRIVVPDNLINMYYDIKANSTLSIDEALFTQWFLSTTGTNYLSYVTLDGVSNSSGTFSYDGTAFQPGTATKFYTTSFTGTMPTSARYIGNVKYKSANSNYCAYVNYTCYGGAAASSANVVKTGTLCICVTPGTVGNISYTVSSGNPKTLDSASFTNVYKTATNTTASSAFRIQLLSVPSNGSLYYGYVSASNKGTLITSANSAGYQLYANSSSASYTIDKLTYVSSSSLGDDGFTYAAYNASGTLQYCGRVIFNTGSGSFVSYSEGYTFVSSDFYDSSNTNPIVSITFGTPSSGRLYYAYSNGSGTAVTSSNKFYTKQSRTGELPIGLVTYIPAAGFSGKATVSYTARTSSGATRTGTLTINVKSKTASSKFGDVTEANTGSWSANSVDYAAAWGLMSGNGTSFSPKGTMTRAMLVSVLYRAAGSPSVSGATTFTDVAKGAYYYDAVIWANSRGIVLGTSATKFSPNTPVSREQIAAFLYRYAQYAKSDMTGTASLGSYTDGAKVSSYARPAMEWAVGSGIITGTSATTLNPGSSATRAQVSVMLHRYLTM